MELEKVESREETSESHDTGYKGRMIVSKGLNLDGRKGLAGQYVVHRTFKCEFMRLKTVYDNPRL